MRWRVAGWAVAVLVGLLMMYPAAGRPLPARAASAPIKVMPLGDSITAGTDASYSQPLASYRCELYKSLVSAGYNVDFVGSVPGQWGVNIGHPLLPPPSYCTMGDLDEEGHSGYAIYHILSGAATWPGKLQDWANAAAPDVVLIHLGTLNFGYGPPEYPAPNVDDAVSQMGQVIDTLRAANPRVRILLAQILPCSCDSQGLIPTFNGRLPALAASKARPYSPIVIVDMNSGFNASHFEPDLVHPNPDGENKMAVRWKAGFDQIMKINNWIFVPLAIK